jgi:hypothetical protein
VLVLAEHGTDRGPAALNSGEHVLDVGAADAKDVTHAQADQPLDDELADEHSSQIARAMPA